MELESHKLFGEGDAILQIFKLIFISLTLIIGAIIIHLDHNINTSDDHLMLHSLQTSNSYVFTVSLVKATEQLQDAISLILSNYSGSDFDIDAELAWKNCSGSILNGWGEIQDAVQHVMMRQRPSDEERGEMRSQIMAAEGFIESCFDDLEKVESTAASEVRAKLILAMVYLSGRGEFLSSYSYFDEIWKRLLKMIVASWGIAFGNLFYIIFCGVQLFFILYMFHKLFKFRST